MSGYNQAINKAEVMASYFAIYSDPDVTVDEVRDPDTWAQLTEEAWKRYRGLTDERRMGLVCGMHYIDSLDRKLSDEKIGGEVVPVLYKIFWAMYDDESNEECIVNLEREKWVVGIRHVWSISDRIG